MNCSLQNYLSQLQYFEKEKSNLINKGIYKS